VKKIPANVQYGRFEKGDQVIAEKRFYALVERYVWPGRDGVPGNAHVNKSTGNWDHLARQGSTITGSTNTVYGLPGSPPLRTVAGSTQLELDLSSGQGQYPWFDGPERVAMEATTQKALGGVYWEESTLENAYNPPQAVIKYRVVSCKYLDQ